MSAEILLASKLSYTEYTSVAFDQSLPPLAETSVRVRPTLLGLGKSNSFYILGGRTLGFWTVWPVPTSVPSSYHTDNWCTAKAWGFAEVLASKTDIPKGSFLFGWWPISSGQHDLVLEPFGASGHYQETSDSRSRLMNMYNHYWVAETPISEWMAAAFVTWGVSHLLAQYSFPEDIERLAPIHPAGHGQGQWTKEDGDLTQSVIIGLSASSKSGRSFSWSLKRNRVANTPLAYLEVSSSPQPTGQASFETNCIKYDSLTTDDTLEWIARFKPSRVLLVDFGARGDTVPCFLQAASATLPETVTFTLVAIGSEQEVMLDPELPKRMSKGNELQRVQCNQSFLQDSAQETVGVESVAHGWCVSFKRWMETEDSEDFSVLTGKGFKGNNGVMKVWGDLSGEKPISLNEAYAFYL
ncbi:hypothetical protein B0J13DRAFT_680988 [Dactylonectria estremocensis]|uniref:Uncharacterized protein n=1 Tax=Dactylonectria estremocensis TaxID=1079267 RepID=A0A9P9DHD7_9HYPO|nr:hypothetical protein B0J13DRAFT_680988 [Dactylonectria estremocensis]